VQASTVLTPCWARAKVRLLEDHYASGHTGERVAKEIVSLSVKHQVLSRFTAYVAVDHSVVVNPGGQPREILQAVEMPAGWASRFSNVFGKALGGAPARAFSMQPMVKMKRSLKVEMPRPSPFDAFEEAFEERLCADMIDLSSYRVRAGQIINETSALLPTDPDAAWGRFELKLKELLDDLRSVKADDPDLIKIVLLVAQWSEAKSDKQKLQKELLEALERFAVNNKPAGAAAAPPAAPPKKRRRLRFWK
jgi:hypothetical protein